ncbi:Dtr system oriT relaxase, partial [Sinorhizobium medicae]|nr:Dtr system oriT relaxase [Sinorhizobium medicae]
LAWTARQSSRLADLAHRLVRIGRKLGLAAGTYPINSQNSKETRPMVAGIATFPESVEQAVADKLAADPGLKKQWDDVSTRFHLVYAHPAAAFKAVNIDVMLKDETAAKATLSKIAKQPDSYGALKGKTGLLASRADRQDHERAVRNVPALVQSLDGYMRQRGSAERRYRTEELEARRKVAIDIPALSPGARQILERVRDAIDRNDLSAALEFARADRHVKAELDGFANAVEARFGKRTFLPLSARDTNGDTFTSVTAGMNPGQRLEVESAWKAMRTVQQLSAHERTTEALKHSETLRLSKSQGLSLR